MCNYCCYRWIYEDRIIYIGKSKNLYSRLKSEAREPKFEPYLDRCRIEYTEFENNAQMSGTESLLIDKYKPELNIADKYDSDKESLFDDSHLVWKDCTNEILADKYNREADALAAQMKNLEEEINLLNFKISCLAKSYGMIEEMISQQYFISDFDREYDEKLLSFPFGKDNSVIDVWGRNRNTASGFFVMVIDFKKLEPDKDGMLKQSNGLWVVGRSSLPYVEEERLKMKTQRDEKQKKLDKVKVEFEDCKCRTGWVKYDYSQYTDGVPFYVLAKPTRKEFADITGQTYNLELYVGSKELLCSKEDDPDRIYLIMGDDESVFVFRDEPLYFCPAQSGREEWDA